MKTLKIIGVILALALVVNYWQFFLIIAAFLGACWGWNEYRKFRIAQRAAVAARIIDLERDLGISQ